MFRKVFKFGGASIKDADAVRNMKTILDRYDERLLVVVSAMGKTTNLLENILQTARQKVDSLDYTILEPIYRYHETILDALFTDKQHPIFDQVSLLLTDLFEKLEETHLPYDYHYDQTVSFGERLSSAIVAAFLNENGVKTKLLDARDFIVTDAFFRNANINWDETSYRINKLRLADNTSKITLTQGFIGSFEEHTTTLGRESSDLTAAIFAHCLDVEEVVIWKDVPGVLNADPKRFENTQKINCLSYSEAIELAFYGATVIHPKTIKPLQNKHIPLKVQSFIEPDISPTIIEDGNHEIYIPSFIVKDKQVLVSIYPLDHSFMNEKNLHTLFGFFDGLNIHINLMQTSALSLSVCFDENSELLSALINSLKDHFIVYYNTGLQLFTIRHYTEGIEKELIKNREILLEQRSRTTFQLVLK
ncbi:MAG: aspartate kinase [Lentimicrobiaceae bacterium]|jgi:aspartate kinase|nr:aspartate kinase [Lentimicrobiaceae bacterium]